MVFPIVKVEAAMRVGLGTVAVNYCCSDYAGELGGDALDGDGFAEEINIAVSGAGVCSGEDVYNVAIGGIVDCGLDVIEIVGPIVVNDDYRRGAGNG
jgi:hypothetical protein